MRHPWAILSAGLVVAVSGGLPVLGAGASTVEGTSAPGSEASAPVEPDAGEVTRDLRPGETTTVLEVDVPPDIDAEQWDGLHVDAGENGDVAVGVSATWGPSAWSTLVSWEGPWADPFAAFHVGVVHADGTFETVVPGGGATTYDGETFPVGIVRAVSAGTEGAVDVVSEAGIHRATGDIVTTTVPSGTIRPPFEVEPGEATTGTYVPADIARDTAGRLYTVETGSLGAWTTRIDPDGTMTTIAGRGDWEEALPPDGALAAEVPLRDLYAVDVDSLGTVYVLHGRTWKDVDLWPVVLKIAPDGTISRVAGSQEPGFSGDGGPATEAALSHNVTDIAVDAEGTLYIADAGNQAIRAVSPDGTITTVGPTISPSSITVTTGGDLYAAVGNQVVRADLREPGIGSCGGELPVAVADPWADEAPGTVVTVDEDTIAEPVSVVIRPDAGVDVVDAESGRLYTIGEDGEVTDTVDGESPLGERVTAVAHGADGVYYAAVDGAVVEVRPDGTRAVVAGGGASHDPPTESTAARSVHLGVTDLECAPDGSLYGATAGSVFRIAPDGGLSTVDDTPATWSRDHNGLGLGRDGRLLWTDPRTLGVSDPSVDARAIVSADNDAAGGDIGVAAASELPLGTVADIVSDADGTLYFSSHDAVRSIDAEGVVTVLDYGDADKDVEGVRAAGLAFDAYGNLYVADPGGGAVRVIVRPGEVGPTRWPWVAAAGGVAALAVGGFLARGRLRLLVSRFGEAGPRRPPPPQR